MKRCLVQWSMTHQEVHGNDKYSDYNNYFYNSLQLTLMNYNYLLLQKNNTLQGSATRGHTFTSSQRFKPTKHRGSRKRFWLVESFVGQLPRVGQCAKFPADQSSSLWNWHRHPVATVRNRTTDDSDFEWNRTWLTQLMVRLVVQRVLKDNKWVLPMWNGCSGDW